MKAGVFLLTMFLIVSVSQAIVVAGPGGLTIRDVIDRAYSQGEINFDTQMLYYAYALRAPQKLPAQYQPYINTLRCGTPLTVSIWQNRSKISAGIYAEIQNMLARPLTVAGGSHSSLYPFWIWYVSASDAGQVSTDIGYTDTSWTTEVLTQLFDAPPPDHWSGYPGGGGTDADFDFYLDSGLPSSAMGVTYPENMYTPTPRFDMTSYIEVLPGMTVPQTEATFAHEFNHGLQMGLDISQQAMMEPGATYSEEVVFDDANDCHGYVSSFQSAPHTNVLSTSGLFPYGAFLFYVFLEDKYFHTPNWYSTAYTTTTNVTSVNEPDIFDSLLTQLQTQGVTMQQMWHEFSIWRIFTSIYADAYHFNEVYPGNPGFVGTYLPGQLPVTNFHPPLAWRPQKAGTSLVRFEPNTTALPFTVCFSGDTASNWAVSLVGTKTGAPPDVFDFTLSDQIGFVTIPDWTPYNYIFLVVTNLEDGDYDTESNWSSSNDWHMSATTGSVTGLGVTNFTAQGSLNNVKLSWQNLGSLPVSGFNIYRAAGNANLPKTTTDLKAYNKINNSLVVGHSPYQFIDREVKPGRSYTYILSAIDADGKEFGCGHTNSNTMTNPVNFNLARPAPNPVSSTTTIRYSITSETRVNLDIYDVSGRLVRTLLSDQASAGEHQVLWDGKDGSGRQAANGVYTVTLTAQGKVETQRLVVAH